MKILLEDAKNDIITIKDIHPILFQTILKCQFWVSNDVDELSLIKKNIIDESNNATRFILTVNPTLNCNFKCWYCYENHIKGSKLSKELIGDINKYINNTLEENKKLKEFVLTFFGGEPLLYFKDICLPLINHWNALTKKYKVKRSLTFTTNGYLIKMNIRIDSTLIFTIFIFSS